MSRDKRHNYWHDPTAPSLSDMGFGGKKDRWTGNHPLGNVSDDWKGGAITTTTGTVYKSCKHDGRTALFSARPQGMPDAPPLTFGGATGSCCDPNDADIVLDLAHNFSSSDGKTKFVKDGPPEWLALNQLVKPRAKIIRLDWPDQKGPGPVPCRFWRSALRLMHKACPQGGHVIVTCFGGHGRTGTCLASILIAHSARTAQSAIERSIATPRLRPRRKRNTSPGS